MNLRTVFRYASNRTMHRFLLYFLTILLCYVMFLLLLASLFCRNYVRHERYMCNRCLNGGIKQCGMLSLESDNAFDPDFLSEISEMEEMVGFTSGGVHQYPVDEIEKFGEQQKEMDSEYFENTGSVPWFYMNQSGIDVCHFNLKEGKRPEEWELKENEILIYLGGNFEDVIVGEKFESKYEPVTYVVGGILEKGTYWICDDVYIFESIESIQDSHYVQCLDNMIVCPDLYWINGRNTYCVKKGYRIEDVETKLLQTAEKYDISIRLARLEDVIEENEYQLSVILNVIHLLTLIIIIASLIVLGHTQYSEMINDTEYFGIFYANGAATKDLIAVLLVENVLKTVLSFVLAVVSGYFILRFQWKMFQPGADLWNTAKFVYFGQAILPSMLIGVGMVAISTVKSVSWLRKKRPVELLRDYKI
ncbi:MAG: ABC transporter permease [Clostridiales bacterium]|nr:ABC transporter permease [Clostridiales bacterium]